MRAVTASPAAMSLTHGGSYVLTAVDEAPKLTGVRSGEVELIRCPSFCRERYLHHQGDRDQLHG